MCCCTTFHTPHCFANVVVRREFERRKQTLRECGFSYTDAALQALFEELSCRISRLGQLELKKPVTRRAAAKKPTTKKTKKRSKK